MEIALYFWVSPGGRQTQFIGWCPERQAWKIKIKEPPREARATHALLKWCSKCLECPLSSFSIDKGAISRSKKVIHSCLKCSPDSIRETFERISIQ